MGKKGKRIGSSVLKSKTPKFHGPTPEELNEIRRRMQEEKEEEQAKRLEPREKTMKVGMPSANGEPEHKAKLISPEDIDETIEKERRERERQKKRKFKVDIEEE